MKRRIQTLTYYVDWERNVNLHRAHQRCEIDLVDEVNHIKLTAAIQSITG